MTLYGRKLKQLVKNKLVVLIGLFVLLFSLSISFVAGFAFGTTTSLMGPIGNLLDTAQPKAPNAAALDSDLDQLREIMGKVAHSYVDPVSKEDLTNGAIDGMLESLDDPYTKHMKNEDYEDFQEHTAGQFGGVGIELGIREKRLTVIAPIKGTPAAEAGVQAGDIITKIESTSTKEMSLDTAVDLIRGPVGTKIDLTFEREGTEDFNRIITRDNIKMPNVNSKVIGEDLGYIMLHSFNRNAAVDVRAELKDLKKKNVRGIIIDLRNNPGGLLDEAVNMTGIFIENETVVKIKSRNGKAEKLTTGRGGDNKIPLVVLINKGSASASEIFAGAVSDLDRGILIGEKTFGKGSVQTVVSLSDRSGLVMTTAKYLTPKNRSLNKKGVKPDKVVKLPNEDFHKMGTDKDSQLLKAREVLRDLIGGKTVKEARK